MTLSLTSSAFKPGTVIPRKYTCDGENLSPPLAWAGAPEGTRSFVLVCLDPDAPRGTFHHWALYDIPAGFTSLAEGAGGPAPADGLREAMTDFGEQAYGGPCPPHGHGPHHYHFRLTALRTAHLGVSPSADCPAVIEAATRQALESAELIGIYER